MPSSSREVIPSLEGKLSETDITVALTEAGLLVERTEEIVRLYAEHRSWTKVKERWHEERVHGRGSRDSAQKIFRIVRRRLQSGGGDLPGISALHTSVQECPTEQAKAQLFYFYLVEEDALFKYVLHELLRQQGVDRDEWVLSPSTITEVLGTFQYSSGDGLGYASSTLHRWAQGFRSVLRDIGVIKEKYDSTGSTPTLDFPPLHVGALYSWNQEETEWTVRPIGWMYLLQPPARQEVLFERLHESNQWSTTRLRDRTVLEPRDPVASE
jgi:hypothetical protein